MSVRTAARRAPAVLTGPLAPLAARATGGHRSLRIAHQVLSMLGTTEPTPPFAAISARGPRLAVDVLLRGPGAAGPGGVPGARLLAEPPLDPVVDPTVVAALPGPTIDRAVGLALAGAALAGLRADTVIDVDPVAVAAQVVLPLLLTPTGPRPDPPTPAGAGGAVCVDLGPDDLDTYPRLLDVLGPGPHPAETLATRAQEWRLAVTPFRAFDADEAWREPILGHRQGRWRDEATTSAAATGPGPAGPAASAETIAPPLAGIRVVDLTAMWGGPLCTWLLACLGAEVVKIEPACRLDGLRFGPGDPGTGDAPLFRALNAGKARAPLDLRDAEQLERFFALVADADVVIDSFSPRVAGNLGIGPDRLRAVRPGVVTVSMPAFPPGPERDWVSYGPGVHAIAGFGDRGEGALPRFVAPPVAYPDPLAGLTAFVAVTAALTGRDRGWVPAHLEVPLRNAPSALAPEPDARQWRALPTFGGTSAANRAPFAGAGLPVRLAAAPTLDAGTGGDRSC